MKYSILPYCICLLSFFTSCTKEESLNKENGLVRIIDSIVMDTQIGCIPLENDNFLVVCQGQIVKFNSSGKIQWKKNVLPPNLILRNVISIPGTGFAAVSISIGISYGLPVIYVSVYDYDGNFISSKGFNLDTPHYSGFVDFIRLSNGNYAFATSSSFTWCSYLKIFDPDFNLLYSKPFCTSGNYEDLTIQGLCETPDGGVAITASLGSSFQLNHFINTAFIVTDPAGNTKSYTILNDSLVNEMSTAVPTYNNGFLAVTSRMIGWETGNGSFVKYYGESSIAGQIGIDRFSTNGQFIGRTEFNDYPGYGLINSIRKTTDGGYILCGTVNNLGSSFTVSKTKIYLCKVDANLNKQWSKVIPTTYQAIGVDAIQDSNGGYRVTGNIKSFDINDKMILIKTDADGNY